MPMSAMQTVRAFRDLGADRWEYPKNYVEIIADDPEAVALLREPLNYYTTELPLLWPWMRMRAERTLALVDVELARRAVDRVLRDP